MKRLSLLFYLCLSFLLLLPTPVSAQSASDWWANNWAMAGANPERTSWTSHQVPSKEYLSANRNVNNNGKLNPEWYKPIHPYIPPKVQIIAAYNTLYISTAKGLYALDAASGTEKWIYSTGMPLGHSPTIYNGVAYVGGFDQKIHAINAYTGEGLWTFSAGTSQQLAAGFDTNPLVVGDKLYAGNRNGVMYAVYIEGPQTGQLAWQYKTGGPIHFSAALKDNTLYFASNDNRAYALNATTGALIWRSDTFPGEGFYSWWPVIYPATSGHSQVVIFVGTSAYRAYVPPRNLNDIQLLETYSLFPGFDPNNSYYSQFFGQTIFPRNSLGLLDTSKSTTLGDVTTLTTSTYFEQKPWRRTYFVLNPQTGQEVTYDFNQNGQSEYAPVLWFNTHSGNRYPPLVGNDQTLYQTNMYTFGGWIQRGQITSWKIGTPFINNPSNHLIAVDEPLAYSSGGNLIYWNHCCDRSAGAFDISVPNNGTSPTYTRDWLYFNYNINSLIPGYDPMYTDPRRLNDWTGVYGTTNGINSAHVSDQNPPIPYNNRVYIHRSNTIIAFSKTTSPVTPLPIFQPPPPKAANPPPINLDGLKAELNAQVEKIIAAGHLRPGWGHSGLFDLQGKEACGDNLSDYWHNPADILYTLTRALPHLSKALIPQVKQYLKTEFETYPPYTYTHTGWRDGKNRDPFEMHPEDEAAAKNWGPTAWSGYGFKGWGTPRPNYPPYIFYAMWKYALTTDNPQQTAQQILTNSINPGGTSKLLPAPSDDLLAFYPFSHNAHISGRIGYLELQKLAGQTESGEVRTELNRLLALRAQNFSKDTPYNYLLGGVDMYCSNMNISRNFIFLVPELGDYLGEHIPEKVTEALDEYSWISPYWFAGKFEATSGEGTFQPYYDPVALLQAKALILNQTREELLLYLDAPAFSTGDLYYIQNLISIIEAPSGGGDGFNPDLNSDSWVDFADYSLLVKDFGSLFSIFDFNRVVSFFGSLLNSLF